jgi:hypothetical protein
MGAIDTEDAARRLARVILSDIDLYIRERPKLGESREAQIEEGRRLFASRVTPALVPVFAMVLADRAAGRVNAPAAAAASSIPASAGAPTVGPIHPPPASRSAVEDEGATDPAIFARSFEDQSPPAPARPARVAAAPSIPARSPADRRSPPPTPAARPVARALPPPPGFARARPGIPVRVPPVPLATQAPAAVAHARPVAPPAPEIPVPEIPAAVPTAPVPSAPVPTARVSIPRRLATVVAAIVALFRRFFRRPGPTG